MGIDQVKDWRTESRQRTHVFNMRLDTQELAMLDALAAHQGLTKAALIRKKVLGSPIPENSHRIPDSSIKPELASLLGELGKIGSNLNQIAKVYNSNAPAPAALHATLMQLQLVAHDARTLLRPTSKSL